MIHLRKQIPLKLLNFGKILIFDFISVSVNFKFSCVAIFGNFNILAHFNFDENVFYVFDRRAFSVN